MWERTFTPDSRQIASSFFCLFFGMAMLGACCIVLGQIKASIVNVPFFSLFSSLPLFFFPGNTMCGLKEIICCFLLNLKSKKYTKETARQTQIFNFYGAILSSQNLWYLDKMTNGNLCTHL
jgi:hypothetical protein